MTDKDCGEIASIKEAFPNATHLICHFHALRAVDRRLENKNGLTQSEISEIYDQFHAAVYAQTPGEFQKAEEYLTSIQHDNIGRYFENGGKWFCDKWVKTWLVQWFLLGWRELANNQKLDQDQIKVRPEDVSTALIERRLRS